MIIKEKCSVKYEQLNELLMFLQDKKNWYQCFKDVNWTARLNLFHMLDISNGLYIPM